MGAPYDCRSHVAGGESAAAGRAGGQRRSECASESFAAGSFAPRAAPRDDCRLESLAGTSISIMNSNCFRRWIACLLLFAPGACFLPAAESASPAPTALAGGRDQPFSFGHGPDQTRRLAGAADSGPGGYAESAVVRHAGHGADGGAHRPGRAHQLPCRRATSLAAGLTIDELRAKMDEALSKFYQNPRTIITPVASTARSTYVLGAVVNRGRLHVSTGL